MADQERQNADGWKCDGWNDAVENRRALTRTMTFRERMVWLERVTKFARKLERSPIVAAPEENRVRAAEGKGTYGSGGGEPGGEGRR